MPKGTVLLAGHTHCGQMAVPILSPLALKAIGVPWGERCGIIQHRSRTAVVTGGLGTSSVRYELAVFRNDETSAAAQGHFIHVYVDRETRRPTPLPPSMRQRLEQYQTSASLTI